MKISAIYTITNLVNNKIYVGSTSNVYIRKYNHFRELRNNKHKNIYLQNSFNKYGEENFVFEILEECEEKYLFSFECFWINMLNTTNFSIGYNLGIPNPINGAMKGNLGKKHTEETKLKISKNRKGKAAGKDNYFYGKKHSEKVKKLMSEKKINKPVSEKTRKKISDANKGKIPKNIEILKNYFKGKKLSHERREQISKSQSKKVYQYTKDMEFIQEFPSGKEAAKILNLADPSSITACAKGSCGKKKVYSAYGYIWKYEKI